MYSVAIVGDTERLLHMPTRVVVRWPSPVTHATYARASPHCRATDARAGTGSLTNTEKVKIQPAER